MFSLKKKNIQLCATFSLILFSQACTTEKFNEEKTKPEVLSEFGSLVQASMALYSERYFAHFNHEKFVGLNSDGSNWNDINELPPLITNGFGAIQKVQSLNFDNVNVFVIDVNNAIWVNEFNQIMTLTTGDVVISVVAVLRYGLKEQALGYWSVFRQAIINTLPSCKSKSSTPDSGCETTN